MSVIGIRNLLTGYRPVLRIGILRRSVPIRKTCRQQASNARCLSSSWATCLLFALQRERPAVQRRRHVHKRRGQSSLSCHTYVTIKSSPSGIDNRFTRALFGYDCFADTKWKPATLYVRIYGVMIQITIYP